MNSEQRETVRRIMASFEKHGCDDNMEFLFFATGKYVTELEADIERGTNHNLELLDEVGGLKEAAQAVVDTSHKDGSGFWGGDYRKLDALAALTKED